MANSGQPINQSNLSQENSYIKFLPGVFQTETEKQFFDATFDQVFSQDQSELITGYLGERASGYYNPISDYYVSEPTKDRTVWQLEPTSYVRDVNNIRDNIFFYEDLLNQLKYYGSDISNQDRLFESKYYSWCPPINVDMFVNYQNYYWVEQRIPAISITGGTGHSPILASDILGLNSYTTPSTAIPPNLTLQTGMRIILTQDSNYLQPHTVDNIGIPGGIRLVPDYPDYTARGQFQFLPWDGTFQLSNGTTINNTKWDQLPWDVQAVASTGDYITIDRSSLDQNAWSRTNKWYSVDVINATIGLTNTTWPSGAIRASRPIIQFNADLELFDAGTQFRSDINYGFTIDQNNASVELSTYQLQPFTLINDNLLISLMPGDLVVFFNDSNGITLDQPEWDVAPWDFVMETDISSAGLNPDDLPNDLIIDPETGIVYVVGVWDTSDVETNIVNQYIFQVVSTTDNLALFLPYTNFSTPVLPGDIVLITESSGIAKTPLAGETWYYQYGTWQEVDNDKYKSNQPPLFQLFDYNFVRLNDPSVYPNNNFAGSEIFSYQINTEPGAFVDPILGFPIVYTGLGQATDILFDNDLMTERYTYNNGQYPIYGYYYYKSLGYDDVPATYGNAWNPYEPTIPSTGACSTVTPVYTSKQRVIDQYVVGYNSVGPQFNVSLDQLYIFELSVIPYGYDEGCSDITVIVDGTIISIANYVIAREINGNVYLDLSSYLTPYIASLPPGSPPPVVEVQTYTHAPLKSAAPGYFEIPQQLSANPNQQEIFSISGSDLSEQFVSIIQNQFGFTGTAYGGTNNYKDSPQNISLGSFILQNNAPLLKTMLISSADDLDIINSVRFSELQYTNFKTKYLNTAKQLINQKFTPAQIQNNEVVISYWVDQIFAILNISKEFSNSFAYSFMVAASAVFASESDIVPAVDPHNSGYSLPLQLNTYIDTSDPRNIIYFYDTTGSAPGDERLLLIGYDYLLTQPTTSSPITVVFNLNSVDVGDSIFVEFYQNPLPTYVPSTPSKIGTYMTYEPQIVLDTSYAIPTNVIVGHDGSRTVVFGDYRDQLLLELEKRIFNGINFLFRNQYNIPLDLAQIKPGYFRETRYPRQEYLSITESYLNKWSAKYGVDYRQNEYSTFSLLVPSGQQWMLWNYTSAVNVSDVPLNLPGNWRGIFYWYYDTIYPDTNPWEMLGFSQMPSWWITQYGSNWSSTNTGLWNDLQAGIIRQGPRAIIDPVTMDPLPNELWARPGLSSIIPVDSAGNIRPVPTIFNVAVASNYEPFEGFMDPWVYGDGSPVEQAWYNSSDYPFSVQEFLYLMNPSQFGELYWDTIGTEYMPSGQYVQNSTYLPYDFYVQVDDYFQNGAIGSGDPYFSWMRPKNSDQIVHAETLPDGTITIRFGYQRWISDYLLYLGEDITQYFGQKIRTLDVNLANKFAGFTNQSTCTVYLESVSPGTSSTSLSVPLNNFEVDLHTSNPIATYSYSGVIIRALANGTFAVYGYDLVNSEFTIYTRQPGSSQQITIGGQPATWTYFQTGASYNPGNIVRYNGAYYESNYAQVNVSSFNALLWTKLGALPTVGGVTVSYNPNPSTTIMKIQYGTVLANVQAVFDFLIGWGDFLSAQGWDFTVVDPTTSMISDWLYSAKQFLFWINSSWAPDASIQLSPLANVASITVAQGYPDNVEKISNGVYSILNQYGVAISPSETTINRSGQTITVTPSDLTAGGIFYLQVSAIEIEHILIFDNETDFNDIIYDPLLQSRQLRLLFNGFRSGNWYGKMEAPGYIILDNQLLPNYNTLVDNIRYFYDPNVQIDNPSAEALARHLIGFQNIDYLDNLELSNDIQYLFYQGAIRQKGTIQSFDKLFRCNTAFGNFNNVTTNESVSIYEEWALLLGEFGNTIQQVSTEFILEPIPNAGNVIVARLNYVPNVIGFVQSIYILNAQNSYTTPPLIIIGAPDVSPDDPRLLYPIRQATAYAILNSSTGTIARIDISDPGYGYTYDPLVTINAGSAPSNLDILYSIYQGEIINDTPVNNIIDIDIDETNVWTVRPPEPEYTLVFPTTDNIYYDIPNAGYANRNDVTWLTFNFNSAFTNWNTPVLNPIEGQTVWIASNSNLDWGIYKLVSYDATIAQSRWDQFLQPPFIDEDQPWDTIFAVDPSIPITNNEVTLWDQGFVFNTDSSGNLILSVIGIDLIAANDINLVSLQYVVTGSPEPIYSYLVSLQSLGTSVTTQQVTIVDDSLDSNTYNVVLTWNNYSLLDSSGNPLDSTQLAEYQFINSLLVFKSMRFMTLPSTFPYYVENNDKVWIDIDPNSKWGVYTISLNSISATVPTLYREQEPLIDTSLFLNAQIYQFKTELQEILLPVYDPFRGILPNLARQNITYFSFQDPARYNITSNPRLYSSSITFGPTQVGQLWWDFTNCRYFYYEQPIALDGSETSTDNLVYIRNNWGQLFPGSSIDIYEWVESTVTPDQYTGPGTPRSTSDAVQITTFNSATNIFVTLYYFWVLNTTNQPNLQNRTLPAIQVSNLLTNPNTQGYTYFAPIQQTSINNSYLFYNVQDILIYQGNNVQVQYRTSQRDDQKHTQWGLYRENDVNSLIPVGYWNKFVDSICGYTDVLPVSDNYSNGIIIGNFNPWDTAPWDISPWDDATSSTIPVYGKIFPVPDPSLSDAEKYGVQYRPRQGMFRNIYAARKIFYQAVNALLLNIPIRDTNPGWNDNILTDNYWTYVNWYAPGYANVKPQVQYQTLAEANAALLAGDLTLNEIVIVIQGTSEPVVADQRYALYVVANSSANSLYLELIGYELSAIQILPTIYTDKFIYELSTELRQILYALYTEVFVESNLVDTNLLFFSMLNYVLSEQKNPNWVFKTSYIYIKENDIPLTQTKFYVPDEITNIIGYINDVKPYHTQIRDYLESYTNLDLAQGTAIDTLNQQITLSFGPGGGDEWPAEWDTELDTSEGHLWDTNGWDSGMPTWVGLYGNVLDAETFVTTIQQYVSDETIYQISLTTYDPSKKGASQLYPYTFSLLGTMPFVVPTNIIAIQIVDIILLYGKDYYVELNTDDTYTVYFYSDPMNTVINPSQIPPVAYVLFDSGSFATLGFNPYRNEIVSGSSRDNLVINVDTEFVVNQIGGGMSIINQTWDLSDPVVENILSENSIEYGWDSSTYWDQDSINLIVNLPYYISSKENTGSGNVAFYRNNNSVAGVLLSGKDHSGNPTTPAIAPTTASFQVQSPNVFQSPTTTTPGALWIGGERIEYRSKVEISSNVWEFGTLIRGTNGTAPDDHIADSSTNVYAELGQNFPPDSNDVIWNLANPTVDVVSLGGLWWAQTPQAIFLKQGPGQIIQ